MQESAAWSIPCSTSCGNPWGDLPQGVHGCFAKYACITLQTAHYFFRAGMVQCSLCREILFLHT